MADQRQELGCLGAEKSFIALQCQLYLGIYGQLFPAQTAQGAVLVRFHGHDNPLILHRNLFQMPIDFRLAQGRALLLAGDAAAVLGLFHALLHDVTDYDLILDVDGDDNIATEDAFVASSGDGHLILDRSSLVVARMVPEQEAPQG